MLNGNAGVRCTYLAEDFSCKIFHYPDRSKVCACFKAEKIIYGEFAQKTYEIIASLDGIKV